MNAVIDRAGQGVTAAAGFVASGVTAGLKPSGKPDVAVVVNQGPRQAAAAVFTTNRVVAAPVVWSRDVVADGRLAAVVLNSGGANACTGAAGYADTQATAAHLGQALAIDPSLVGVCSTGLIGQRLPMPALLAGVDAAVGSLSSQGGVDAAAAIMTTDTVPKLAQFTHPDGWTIGAMAKGAGMLAPALATMLVVVTTDAEVAAAELDEALMGACSVTLDRLDSDGCMSTNDTVFLLASGASEATPSLPEFQVALTAVLHDLGQQLLADAEGAHHQIAISVSGAVSLDDALMVGRAIARSNLFKCAIFGGDPNWGRALAALGTTSAVFDPDAVNVSFNGVQVCRGGAVGEDRGLVDLSATEVVVEVDLAAGDASATIWTNDLTHDYVTENSEYST